MTSIEIADIFTALVNSGYTEEETSDIIEIILSQLGKEN